MYVFIYIYLKICIYIYTFSSEVYRTLGSEMMGCELSLPAWLSVFFNGHPRSPPKNLDRKQRWEVLNENPVFFAPHKDQQHQQLRQVKQQNAGELST